MSLPKVMINVYAQAEFGSNDLCCLHSTAKITTVDDLSSLPKQSFRKRMRLFNAGLCKLAIEMALLFARKIPLGLAVPYHEHNCRFGVFHFHYSS